MAISKPSWLRVWLDGLNWDIFSWKVYVGDAIESGIDWILTWIDSWVEWAVAIGAWWEDFRSEVIEGFEILQAAIGGGLSELRLLIDTWWSSLAGWWETKRLEVIALINTVWSELGDWWEARKLEVLDLIDAAVDWIGDRLDDAERLISTIEAAWRHFTTTILPTLATHLDVDAAIRALLKTWEDLFNTWEELKGDIIDFFTDPLKWLYDRLDDFFERYW